MKFLLRRAKCDIPRLLIHAGQRQRLRNLEVDRVLQLLLEVVHHGVLPAVLRLRAHGGEEARLLFGKAGQRIKNLRATGAPKGMVLWPRIPPKSMR